MVILEILELRKVFCTLNKIFNQTFVVGQLLKIVDESVKKIMIYFTVQVPCLADILRLDLAVFYKIFVAIDHNWNCEIQMLE